MESNFDQSRTAGVNAVKHTRAGVNAGDRYGQILVKVCLDQRAQV
jgi:hypothetical protein